MLQHVANYAMVKKLNGKWVPKGAGVIAVNRLVLN